MHAAKSVFQNFLPMLTVILFLLCQYYYAHANKNFNTDGAKHFEGDGKIYGGDPVLIRTESQVEVQNQAAAQQTV